MTKNRLSDLNDHLFAQLERLGDEALTSDQIEVELERTQAIVAVSTQIIRNADLRLKAEIAVAEHCLARSDLPMLKAPE